MEPPSISLEKAVANSTAAEKAMLEHLVEIGPVQMKWRHRPSRPHSRSNRAAQARSARDHVIDADPRSDCLAAERCRPQGEIYTITHNPKHRWYYFPRSAMKSCCSRATIR